MIIKKHFTSDNRLILAICDKEILGKKFEDSDRIIDTTSEFYQGSESSPEIILELIKTAYTINVVGKKSVNLCIKNKIINSENVINIKGVPLASMVRM
ncbi:MAG: hypothetical protein MAG795_01052 [Candidatus Woesearchaeota archaeon]|nr:hypothetical protein [Candidatus Woesearchaeota archaeon]